jgi:peptidoglycan/LPS O-acetylase OafA/YrhL
MKYRSDIDGMRCLAVVSVILFHLNEKIVPGGFTGVDIFFVISGFLITRIIVDGLRTGDFSMSRFYARRVRRIFPALFTVLLSCSVLAVVAFEPDTYKQFFDELPYAVLQASNFLFVQQVGYFEAANESSPLLHTWSLGVEEQFYLIWPLLLMVFFHFWKKKVAHILFGLALFSFIYSQYLCLHSPKVAFYMLHSRAWELALGGLLVVANIPESKSKVLNNILAVFGLALVFAGFGILDSATLFPGTAALLPVLGTVFILYSGQSGNSFLFKVLSWRPFVAIGVVSYSLYLWHWPLIVFAKTIIGSEITFAMGCGIFFTSLLMATLSFYVVERPFRYGILPQWPVRFLVTISSVSRYSYRVFIYLSLCIFLPIFLVWVFISSVSMEENRTITTIQMDVELLESTEDPFNEQISIYWRGRKSPFQTENSVFLAYDNENRVSEDRYQFTFKLPDLSTLKSIRLDPLISKGKVNISNVVVSGGFFNLQQRIDVETLFSGISGLSPDVKAITFHDGLLVESGGSDPYFILFNPPLVNPFDFLLLFVFFIFLLVIFMAYAAFLRKDKMNKAVLSGGVITISLTLLLSVRLQYSNYSQWRFVDDKNSEFLLSATAMTEMAQFPESMESNVVLLGDSHAGYYALPVQKWSEKNGYSFGVFAQPACPPLLYHGIGVEGWKALNSKFHICTKLNNQYIDRILQNPETKFVFISTRQDYYFANPFMFFNKKGMKLITESTTAEDILKESFANTIRTLQNGGKKVVILGQTPVLKESPKKCLSRNVTLLSLPYKETESCDMDKTFSDNRLLTGKEFFQQLDNSFDLVHYFNTSQYIYSIFGEDKTILYYDDNHLSHQGSLYITPYLEDDLLQFGMSEKNTRSQI